MNKRIQKKIAKRIINKIGTEQPLTKFERKYFIKFFWKPLKTEVARIVEELKIEEELVKEKIEELSIAEEIAVEQAEIFKSMDYSEENTAGVLGNMVIETTVEEPSKWNKLKGKVKGWFGK